jgi:hypothetical protein
MHRFIHPVLVGIALSWLFLLALPAAGQSIEGVLRDVDTGDPIDAALVVALDDAGSRVAGTLTARDGSFRIPLPATGTFRLLAERIGYEARSSDPIQVASEERVVEDLLIPTRPISLEGISVRSERRCRVRPEEGLLAATLWEEARKALEATDLSRRELLQFTTERYVRELDAGARQVRAEESTRRSGFSDSPFGALSAEDLIEKGFSQGPAEERVYYAPDAHTLLSDAFLDSYCFRGVEPGPDDPSGTVGLAFEPDSRRGGPAGISGTLWIDRASNELRVLEFTYLDADLRRWRSRIGGRVEFQRLPTGAWMVSAWRIRMPKVEHRSAQTPLPGRPVREPVLAGIIEEGGEVSSVRAATGSLLHRRERATLAGEAFDSVRHEPLGGATVFLEGTQYNTETDRAGQFLLEDLPEGEYVVAAHHPRLDSLGIRLPTERVTLRPGTASTVVFAVPSLGSLLAADCPDPGPGMRAIVGRVSDAGSDASLPGARVTAGWGAGAAEVMSDRSGFFRICDVPADAEVRLEADFAGRVGEPIAATAGSGTTRRDLMVGVVEPTPVAGRVLDWETGTPIRGARIRLPRLGVERLTGSDGGFSLGDVPPGTYTMEVEHIGYGTRTETVEIARGDADDLEIRLPAEALAIEGVEVEVRSRRLGAGRARGTRQDVMTRAEIARYAGAGNVGDLARRFPGVTSRPIYHANSALEAGICIEAPARDILRGAMEADECRSLLIVVDGMPMPGETGAAYLSSLPLHQIESIEYFNAIEARPRYGGRAGYGALVIYTRGNGPHAEQPH